MLKRVLKTYIIFIILLKNLFIANSLLIFDKVPIQRRMNKLWSNIIMIEASKVTFPSTTETVCPVCDYEFYIEKLRGKRVNAGEIDDELRRQYVPMKEYGKVYPLVYPVVVCPDCLYATYGYDFNKIKPKQKIEIEETQETRRKYIDVMFGEELDFEDRRTLKHGIASYVLAMNCYSYMPADMAPTFKRGLSALRAAWLLDTLTKEDPENEKKYAYLRDTFYLKAEHYYAKSIIFEQKGKERLEMVENLGPDTDNDYQYDGVKYISSVLSYKLSFLDPDLESRIQKYTSLKSTMGRLFGFGRSSKEKPGPILEKAKELYDSLQQSIKELEESMQ